LMTSVINFMTGLIRAVLTASSQVTQNTIVTGGRRISFWADFICIKGEFTCFPYLKQNLPLKSPSVYADY
jgi:hypothetical protein